MPRTGRHKPLPAPPLETGPNTPHNMSPTARVRHLKTSPPPLSAMIPLPTPPPSTTHSSPVPSPRAHHILSPSPRSSSLTIEVNMKRLLAKPAPPYARGGYASGSDSEGTCSFSEISDLRRIKTGMAAPTSTSRPGSPFGSKVDLTTNPRRSEDGLSLLHLRAVSPSQMGSDGGHPSGQRGGGGYVSPVPHSRLVSSPISTPVSTGKKPRNVLRRRPSATQRDKETLNKTTISSSTPTSPTYTPGIVRALTTRLMTTSNAGKTTTTTDTPNFNAVRNIKEEAMKKVTRSASFSSLAGKKTKKTTSGNTPTPKLTPSAAPVSPSVDNADPAPNVNDTHTPASAFAEAYRRQQEAYQHNDLEVSPNTPESPHAHIPYYTVVGTSTPRVAADERHHPHMSWTPDLAIGVIGGGGSRVSLISGADKGKEKEGEKLGFAKSVTRKVSGKWKKGGDGEIGKKRSRSGDGDRDRDKAGDGRSELRTEGRGRRERSATVGAATSGSGGWQTTVSPSQRLAAGDADGVRPGEGPPEAGASRTKKLRLSLSYDGIASSDLGALGLGLGLDSPLRFGKEGVFEDEIEREEARGRKSDVEGWHRGLSTPTPTPPPPPPQNSAANGFGVLFYGSKALPSTPTSIPTTPTKTPPTPSPVSATGTGSRIWKLVKKISVGGLRERYHHDHEAAPPVPALPKDVRQKTSGVVDKKVQRMSEGGKEPETGTKSKTALPTRANSVQATVAASRERRARKTLVKKASQSFSVSRSQMQAQMEVPLPVLGVAASGAVAGKRGWDQHDTLVRQVTAGTTDSPSPPRLFLSSGRSSASSLSLVGGRDREREGEKDEEEDKSELDIRTPPGRWIIPPSELGKLYVAKEEVSCGVEDGREVDDKRHGEDWMTSWAPSLPLASLPFPPRRSQNHVGGEGGNDGDDGGALMLDGDDQDDERPASPQIPVFSAADPINAFSPKRGSVSPLKASPGSCSPWTMRSGEEGDEREREIGWSSTTVGGRPRSQRELSSPSSPGLESSAGGLEKDENEKERNHFEINPSRLPASMRRDFGLDSPASPGPTLTRGALRPDLFQAPTPVASDIKRRSIGDYSTLSMGSTASTTVTARPSLGDVTYYGQQYQGGTVGRKPSGGSLFSLPSPTTTEGGVSQVRLRRERRRRYGTFGEQFGDEVVVGRKSGDGEEEEDQDGSWRRKPLTEREKVERWEDLLVRSARAGGTLHLDVNGREDGLKGDQMKFSEFSEIRW